MYAAQQFSSQIDATIATYAICNSTNETALTKAINQYQPDLIFTIGVEPTLWAKQYINNTTVLFAMVLDYKSYDLDNYPNFIGISVETPPLTEFIKFKMMLPSLAKVLTFYQQNHPNSSIIEAKKQVESLGIEIIPVAISNQDQISLTIDKYAHEIHGVWFANDKFIMNTEMFYFLQRLTFKYKLPLFTSLSDKFARAGALMSVSIDLHQIGNQAAALARVILESNKSLKEIGMQPPISTNLVVNQAIANKLNITIPNEIVPFINEIINPPNH
ncbi:MAG: hypothetical protein JW841_06075 [Deltaproteobacteria bacterium]|nr:hypothetical protein [Deltaproteobacteria bacterium]